MFKSRDDLTGFVAGLRIPESRRRLVELELLDHLESRIAVELAAGEDHTGAERKALAALGDPKQLRASLERIEPAFEIDPLRATVRGLASAIGASIVFVIVGALLPFRGPALAANLAAGSLLAVCGACVIWLLAPRGIGAAIVSEARASIERQLRPTPRRRAVTGYIASILLVHMVVQTLFFTDVIETVGEAILLGWGMLGLVYGPYVLHVMRSARKEQALVRAIHGS